MGPWCQNNLKPGTDKINYCSPAFSSYFHPQTSTGEVPGNNYTNLYNNVNQYTIQEIYWEFVCNFIDIGKWHQLCFNNKLPQWLRGKNGDGYSVATMAKTGICRKDGGWRQWESFSCPAVDPKGSYTFLSFSALCLRFSGGRGVLRGYAAAGWMRYIQENLGYAPSGLDKPSGR